MNQGRIALIKSTDSLSVNRVVEIHMGAFKGFFLTSLGVGFLRLLYSFYVSSPKSGVFGYFDGNGVLQGFLAFSGDLSGLYKRMIVRRLPLFAWYSLGALVRNPKIISRLVGALFYPSATKRTEAYVELASIGVMPDVKSSGIGSKLVSALKENVDFSKFEYITCETDAVDNEAANAFYRKNGFVLAREYSTRQGRKMNEYRFYKEG